MIKYVQKLGFYLFTGWQKNSKTNEKSRDSHPEVFCQRKVLKNVAKFTPAMESLFNRVTGLK